MNVFFESIDLSANIVKGLRAVHGLGRIPSLILGCVLLYLCFLMWPWLWFFDLESTQVWVKTAMDRIVPTMSTEYKDYAAAIGLGILIMPSLIEMFAVRFSRVNIFAAHVLVFGFSLLDMVTDRPRAFEFVEGFRDSLSPSLSLFTPMAMWGLKISFLFLASFYLELLFIVFLICAVKCFLQVGVGHSSSVSSRFAAADD